MEDLISVIVPVYKAENYLNECIDSIINQSYNNLEIILIDDGSPDSSGKICDKYAKKDNRIKVIHKENGGVSSARNEGLKIFKGKYFTFVDSDDKIDIYYLEIMYDYIIKNNADMCISKNFHFKNNIGRNSIKNNGINKEILFSNYKELDIAHIINYYHGSGVTAKLYRVTNDIPVFEKIKIGEDLLFNIDYMNHLNKVLFLDYNGYFYRISEESLTNSMQDSLLSDLEKIIIKKNLKYGIYSVYCFRIYNEQICNIYSNKPKNLYKTIKTIDKLPYLKDMISNKNSTKIIIKLTGKKINYIKLITFFIRNNFYILATILERIKYKVKK